MCRNRRFSISRKCAHKATSQRPPLLYSFIVCSPKVSQQRLLVCVCACVRVGLPTPLSFVDQNTPSLSSLTQLNLPTVTLQSPPASQKIQSLHILYIFSSGFPIKINNQTLRYPCRLLTANDSLPNTFGKVSLFRNVDLCVSRTRTGVGDSVREKTGWSSKTSKQPEAHQVKRLRPECHLHNSLQPLTSLDAHSDVCQRRIHAQLVCKTSTGRMFQE